jgi:hypothetical protein
MCRALPGKAEQAAWEAAEKVLAFYACLCCIF